MRKTMLTLGTGALTLAVSQALYAGTEPFFTPLTQSTAVTDPNQINELNSPWQTPAGLTQTNLMSMAEVEADVTQSIQRVAAGRNSSMFDMLAYDPSGRYIFIPHETPTGAGVTRYDTQTDTSELIFAGDQGAVATPECDADPEEPRDPTEACPAWDLDFAAFDPARWTPNGTVFLAEEWSGLGRVVEVMNPLTASPADPSAAVLQDGVDYRVLDSIAKVAHEGINFSEKYPNEVIYFIDEWRSGSIYMLVLKTPGDYAAGGQTFVLSVDAFAGSGGDPTLNYNDGPNPNAIRTGMATWKPITDANGNPLPGITDPFRDGPTNDPNTNDDTRGGRVAADEIGGTPYGRPEDMEVGSLPNGNEILYITVTSEAAVISVEILGNKRAMVREFAGPNTTKNKGFLPTTAVLNSPDNLAQDALGNIYIIEDSPNSGNVGGDIWFARDTNNDGVAESIDHFMSLQVNGSESTGMIWHPQDPSRFVVAVQHPSSTDLANVPDGFGDAVWEFNVSDVAPPMCQQGLRGVVYSWKTRKWIQTCSNYGDVNFFDVLERAGRPQPRKGRWHNNNRWNNWGW